MFMKSILPFAFAVSILFVSSDSTWSQAERERKPTIYKRTFERVEKRSENNRVLVNVHNVPVYDIHGNPTGASEEKEVEIFEKGNNLFHRDPITGEFEPTRTTWGRVGSNRFDSNSSRADRVSVAVEERSKQVQLDYSGDGLRSISLHPLAMGLFDAKADRYIKVSDLTGARLTGLSRRDLDGDGRWDQCRFKTHLTNSGVHFDFLLDDRPEIPTEVMENIDSNTTYFVFEYEIASSNEGLRAFLAKSPIDVGETRNLGSRQLSLGWDEGAPELSLRPSKYFSANQKTPAESTWKRVEVKEDRITIYEGVPLTWLTSEERAYPVTIDPYIQRTGTGVLLGETWESGKTYFVSGDFMVPDGGHLVIEGGAVVKINGPVVVLNDPPDPPTVTHTGITAGDGAAISVLGGPYNYAIITSADDDTVGETIPEQNRRNGLHGGVTVGADNRNSVFRYAKLTNGFSGIGIIQLAPSSSGPVEFEIRDCVFENVSNWAIWLQGADSSHQCIGGSTCRDPEIRITNNLFKRFRGDTDDTARGLEKDDRTEDVAIVPHGQSLSVQIQNNTFANTNTLGGRAHIRIGMLSAFPMTKEVRVDLFSNLFVRTSSSQAVCRGYVGNGVSVNGEVSINEKTNIVWTDPDGGDSGLFDGGGISSESKWTVTNDGLLQTLSTSPFLEIDKEVLGSEGCGSCSESAPCSEKAWSYFIDPAHLDKFENKGHTSVGAVGLEGKTIKAPTVLCPQETPTPLPTESPTPLPGEFITPIEWSKKNRDGGDLTGQANDDICDIGYHYDPVDYYLASWLTVTEYDRLFIKPGTVIAVANNSELIVRGASVPGQYKWSAGIEAVGMPGEEIVWIPDVDAGDHVGMGHPDYWNGVDLSQMTEFSPSSLEYNIVNCAFYGVDIRLHRRKARVTFANNVINKSLLGAYVGDDRSHVYGDESEPLPQIDLLNNRFVNSGSAYSLSVWNTNANIIGNTISGTADTGILSRNYDLDPIPRFSGNVVIGHKKGIVLEYYDDSEPQLGPNIVWDWSESAHDYSLSDLEDPTFPLTGNPRVVSSNTMGYFDSSEHFFLPQLDGDASRLPWRASDITNIELRNVTDGNNGSHPFHGEVEIKSVNDQMQSTSLGTYSLESPASFEDGSTGVGHILLILRGPMIIGGDGRLVITRAGGSRMEIALTPYLSPRAGHDSVNQNYREEIPLWIALDGSLYFAATPFPSRFRADDFDGKYTHTTFNMTALYAMQYFPAFSGPWDHPSFRYVNALAVSAHDERLASSAKNLPYFGPSPVYDYPGTASRFKKSPDGNANTLIPFPDSGFPDLGYHGFRGRQWVRDPNKGLQLSWDRPEGQEAALAPYRGYFVPFAEPTPHPTPDPTTWFAVNEDSLMNPHGTPQPTPAGTPLPETDLEHPHELHVRSVVTIENTKVAGPPSKILFGVDGTAPVGEIVDIKAGDESKADKLYFEADTDTIYVDPTALPTPFPIQVLMDAVDPTPAPNRTGSGPWKFEVLKSTGYTDEFPFDPLRPSVVIVDSEDFFSENFSIDVYDRAGNKGVVSPGEIAIEEDCDPPQIDTFTVPSSPLRGDVSVTIEVSDPDSPCAASGVKSIELYAKPLSDVQGHPLYTVDRILLNRVDSPSNSETLTWNTSILPSDPQHYGVVVYAVVTDRVGHVKNSELITRYIDNTPPPTPASGTSSIVVENLRTEYQVNPLALDEQEPRFSWELNETGARGLQQMKYQIQVTKKANDYDVSEVVWDDVVLSDSMNQIEYDGDPLQARRQYYWRVKVWDNVHSNPTAWSAEASFRMGLLDEFDHSGDGWDEDTEWIAVKDAENAARMGYRSLPTTDEFGTAVVMIDLGAPKSFDEIALYPVWWPPEQPIRVDSQRFLGAGYLFPLIYSIEASNDPTFQKSKAKVAVLVEPKAPKSKLAAPTPLKDLGYARETAPIPRAEKVSEWVNLKEDEFRYIRIISQPFKYDSENTQPALSLIHETDPFRSEGLGGDPCCTYGIAFAEIQVLENGVNIALDASVSGRTDARAGAVDVHPWKPEYLTDGINHSGSIPASYFRMKAPKSIPTEYDPEGGDRLLAYVIGLGAYDFYINGMPATGDGVDKFALGPSWTDFNKRIQYQVFDLGHLGLQAGQDIVASAVVGDGRFLDSTFFFGGSWYGQKHLFRMEIVMEDASEGTRTVVAQTNETNQTNEAYWVGTLGGPIRYSGVDNAEFYLKGLEIERIAPDATRTPVPAWTDESFPFNGWTLTAKVSAEPTVAPAPYSDVELPAHSTLAITANPPGSGANAGFKLPLIVTGAAIPGGETVRILGVTPDGRDTVSYEDMVLYKGVLGTELSGVPPIGFARKLPITTFPNFLQVDVRRLDDSTPAYKWLLVNKTDDPVTVHFGWRTAEAGGTVFPIPTNTPVWTPRATCSFTPTPTPPESWSQYYDGGTPPAPTPAITPILESQADEYVRIVARITPISTRISSSGNRVILDFGQMAAGKARVKLEIPTPAESSASPDQRYAVRINYSEAQIPANKGFLDPTPLPTAPPQNINATPVRTPIRDLDMSNLIYVQPTDHFLLRPGDVHWCESRFTRHGFRYVEVVGIEPSWIAEDEGQVQQFADVVQSKLASPLSKTPGATDPEVPPVPSGLGDVIGNGAFCCSDPDLNAIMDAVSRSIRIAIVGHPAATVGRGERVGWADFYHRTESAAFDREVVRNVSKWIQDHRDHQTEVGGFPDIVPMFGNHSPFWAWTPYSTEVSVDVAHVLYQFYGDKKVASDHYAASKKLIDGIKEMNNETTPGNYLWTNRTGQRYGDWQNAGVIVGIEDWYGGGADTDFTVLATAVYAKLAQRVSDMAGILDLSADRQAYQELANHIRRDFVAFLVNTTDNSEYGKIQSDTISAYANALELGLLVDPEVTPGGSQPSPTCPNLEAVARRRLVEIVYGNDFHTPSGYWGTRPTLFQLVKAGRTDLAYRILFQRKPPSWIYMIENGATTLWEGWQSLIPNEPLSHVNQHFELHAGTHTLIGEWIHRNIVGVNPETPDFPLTSENPKDRARPGFKRFTVHPRLGGDLTCARGVYDTIHGRIEVHWWIEEGESRKFHLKVKVPIGTEALIYVTAENEGSVKEVGSGTDIDPATDSPNIIRRPDLDDENRLAYEAASGDYEFVSTSDVLFPEACDCEDACEGDCEGDCCECQPAPSE